MLARTPEKERIESGMHALAYGLFVPIFFVNIGLSIDLREFQLQALLFTIVIILVAVAGKWIGSSWGARLGGLSQRRIDTTWRGHDLARRSGFDRGKRGYARWFGKR